MNKKSSCCHHGDLTYEVSEQNGIMYAYLSILFNREIIDRSAGATKTAELVYLGSGNLLSSYLILRLVEALFSYNTPYFTFSIPIF
ncbi:hypothetical protein ACOMCU_27655 [Lysinibacillus sp. UGB7]|uniref:hypothetical protein n=1 Tax=Lysinibacillus sp. UGB7 TaxID=3411039 RepID=UPI003B7E81B7